MGWMDKALATAKLTADKAVSFSKDLAEEFDAGLNSRDDYKTAKELAADLRTMGKRVAVGARDLSAEVAREVGETERGAKAGQKMRSAAGVLGTLPLITAVTDAAKAHHGVDDLYATLLIEPQDPERAVWLAEALDRVQRDLTTYRRVRSVTSFTYAARRKLIVSALELGRQPVDATRVRLLKSAYGRARSTLRTDPVDAQALHVLSRVYLAQGDVNSALRLVKLAILISPSDGLPWITLSRCFLAAKQYPSAKEAAERAVAAGAGYGNQLLAQLVMARSTEGTAQTAAEYDRLRSLVSIEDRSAYLGTAVDPRAGVRHIKDEQVRRAVGAFELMKGTR